MCTKTEHFHIEECVITAGNTNLGDTALQINKKSENKILFPVKCSDHRIES